MNRSTMMHLERTPKDFVATSSGVVQQVTRLLVVAEVDESTRVWIQTIRPIPVIPAGVEHDETMTAHLACCTESTLAARPRQKLGDRIV